MANRKQEIKEFLIHNLGEHPRDIVRFSSEHFGVSRQLVNRYLHELVQEKKITASGKTRKQYALATEEIAFSYEITPGLQEDKVWRDDIAPLLNNVPPNVREISQYGATEMINNAIDHSEGKQMLIKVKNNQEQIELAILDDGVGIFRKIKNRLHLDDERHAILELAKGKLTTDPKHHTGEGIFFTSRVFDNFYILSGSLRFAHTPEDKDWLLEDNQGEIIKGTLVHMTIHMNSDRVIKDVMDRYAPGRNDHGFSKTIIPVFLARYGDENLISRSQAKRLLANIEHFREVILDFDKVNTIGPAFADEVFRVWRNEHPDVQVIPLHANHEVSQAILRALENS